jgi:arsenate reductase
VDAALGGLAWWRALAYVPVQIAGCVSGAVVANLMFSAPAISISTKDRATTAHGLAEVVATIGLVLVIFTLTRSGRGERAPAAVGAYIGAAYWFTSSTSFANPAITIGRMFSDTFAGIAPSSVPLFLAAQLVGGGLAVLLVRGLYPTGAGPGTTSTVQRARSESGTTRQPLPHRGCPLVGRTPAPRAIRSGHFASARSRRLCSARDTRTGLDESGAVTALRMAVFGPGGRDHICTV